MKSRVERRLRRDRQPEGYLPWRLALALVLVGAWMVLLGGRLYRLQVVDFEHYQKAARQQQERRIEEHPPRGIILDRRGRELAVSVEVPTVFVDPELMREQEIDQDAVAMQLADALDLDLDEVREKLDRPSSFAYVKRRVSEAEAAAVRELAIPGVGFLAENQRVYPMGELAAHVLGFVGRENKGLAGLELRYQDEIAGAPAVRLVRRDASGDLVVVPTALGPQARAGANLVLTIDARLQYLAERELDRALRETGARAGSVVVLDPRDSAVLAMATLPAFDPNHYQQSPPSVRRNRAVMDAYEPGSTFKMVTAAAALDSLAVHPDDRFDCEMGGVRIEKAYIRDHKPFGVLTFRDVLANSSNVGVIKAALRTGTQQLATTVVDFGFGSRTGIDLPGESAGIVLRPERWSRMSAAYASFGHGISVTPIQLVNAYAALINGGTLNQPYVVRALRRGDEVKDTLRPEGRPLAISAKTRLELVRLLENVVENGTGRRAGLPGYRVAGKTGTAEKSSSEGMSAHGRVASFVGFAPARSPRIVALVMLDEPRVTASGGLLAAPVFARIAQAALVYLGVAPVVEEWQRADHLIYSDPPPKSPDQPILLAERRDVGGAP